MSAAPPPAPAAWKRWRDGLVGTPGNALITLACLAALAWAVPPLARWAVLDATWTGTAADCRAAGGACWAFVGEKLRFILFGFYPPGRDWRPGAVIALLLAMMAASAVPRLWGRRLVPLWGAALGLCVLLMAGRPGGAPVPTDAWGGLSLTLLLTVVSVLGAFPLAVLLALARRSRMGLVRLYAVTVIEVTRGVPFIAVLYVAALALPLMLPAGGSVDKLLRAQVAFILFVAAYLAEVVRAGLQAVPGGQYEAARALGLGWWAMMRHVVLPQALRTVIPAIVTLSIGVFQDTTLIIVIGLFDFLNSARTATSDPDWQGFYDEAFGFAALVYFAGCFVASRYSLWLEARLGRGGGS